MALTRILTLGAATLCLLGAPQVADAQTYRHQWTTTEDFEGGTLVNTSASEVPDQVQLTLSGIETPYLWVANSGSNTVSQIDTATGAVLNVAPVPYAQPSRTAVDLDFNCWVTYRAETSGRATKLSAETGDVVGHTPYVGNQTRGVAVTADGSVWVASTRVDAQNGQDPRWMRIDPNTLQPTRTFLNPLASYGLTISPFGSMFSTTAWMGGRSIQKVDSDRGFVEQRWRLDDNSEGDVYGIASDVEGNIWGALWVAPAVLWIDGSYECPDELQDCTITEGNGIIRRIDVEPALLAAGGIGQFAGRGIATDANGFVWAIFNDLGSCGWECSNSYAVKIDGGTGEVIIATRVGTGTVGVTPDANGFIWVVNRGGGGANFINLACPDNAGGSGTVSKLRSSDGTVVATYSTCGNFPYTYSDMAGYNLRSVTLRSGTWRAVHDATTPGRQWGAVRWTARTFDDTTFRIRLRAADRREDLAAAPFIEVENGQALNDAQELDLEGRYVEVEAFFFTRNDFLGPALEDLTLEGECEAQAEVCDGFDNNCNGIIDDGDPGGGARCDTGLPGRCATGVEHCDRGQFLCRSVDDPVAEVCNGLDDNCNGRIDEGVTNLCGECGQAPTEVCDGEDNDCDGLTDEGVQNACGGCGPVPREVCDGRDNDCDGLTDEGLLNDCGECGPTPTEVCDGADNDCDGLVDEEVANDCGGCGPAPTEVCDGRDNDCDGVVDENLINRCGLCGPDPPEFCDGVDNDCDGEIDENVLNACGFCGAEPEEICDGADNDCDGEVDEGVKNNCGGCGPTPEEVCNGVDDDCDGDVDEGVQNACGSCGVVPEEICDGQDNDCDGEIDERVTNACGTCGELSDDVCDGIDNDCDGDLDEDPECANGTSCAAGQCAEPCAAGECARGFYCEDGFCIVDTCLGLRCADGQVCEDGACVDLRQVGCEGVECPRGQVCLAGECADDPCDGVDCGVGDACWLGDCIDAGDAACRQLTCEPGFVCDNGACVEDPCNQVRCDAGLVCRDGACADACDDIECNVGFDCNRGVCVADACFNVVCGEGRLCVDGNCVYEGCVDTVCPDGEQCGPSGCEPLGACGDAVCVGGEVCEDGQCVDPNRPVGPGPDQDAPGATSDCGCATQHDSTPWWRKLLRR